MINKQKMKQYFAAGMLCIIVLIVGQGCGNKKNTTGTTQVTNEPPIDFPAFNADSAYAMVARQVAFGPRVTNSKASSACEKFLVRELTKYTPDVMVQNFKARIYNGDILNGKNIVASFNKTNPNRIVLASHWDSRPFADHDPLVENHSKPIDGANDGASGVGVLLEIARILGNKAPEIGVDIVLFDAEDYGPPQDTQGEESEESWGLGSQHWSKNPHVYGYKARFGILLDMVGVTNPTFLMEGFSTYYAPAVVKKVWDIAAQAGYSDAFIPEQGTYITDDHYFVNKLASIPMIDIIHLNKNTKESSFFPHWHTVNDNLSNVDIRSLSMVGDVIVRVIYSEK
jgi:hypothetical protein